MNRPICKTCGTQFDDRPTPPTHCPICTDERQYVGWNGQTWTTHEALRASHSLRIGDDAGLLAIGMTPDFAIPQRALFLPTDAGNLLWECVSLVNDAVVETLRARGGVDRIVISHPHFYSSMVEWSDALGGVPILLHEADREWVQRGSKRIEFWSGDRLALSDDVTLLRCGGHFPGSTAIHWRRGPRGAALFPSDALQVVMDRRHVTFMYSYPNFMPMPPHDVRHMRDLLAGLPIDDVFGFSWGRNILGGARAAVDASFDRYLRAVAA
jgi:hypothetical protein